MGKRTFTVRVSCIATLELDDAVIDVVDDEWRKKFYKLRTPKHIAEHITYNRVVNGARLSHLDGWADQDDDNAVLRDEDWDVFAEEQ